MQKSFKQLIFPLFIAWLISAGLLLAFNNKLEAKHIKVLVVHFANALLLGFSVLNIYFQYNNINNPNPNAVIRGVMLGMFLKLFGLAAAAVIYLFAAGAARSVYAVFTSMALYIVYTWLEVRISLQLNPKK